jgi:hypothetical protein
MLSSCPQRRVGRALPADFPSCHLPRSSRRSPLAGDALPISARGAACSRSGSLQNRTADRRRRPSHFSMRGRQISNQRESHTAWRLPSTKVGKSVSRAVLFEEASGNRSCVASASAMRKESISLLTPAARPVVSNSLRHSGPTTRGSTSSLDQVHLAPVPQQPRSATAGIKGHSLHDQLR